MFAFAFVTNTHTGADTVRSYQTILRQIVYFNRKPANYLNRAFKLSCSELNGRFTSNDYIQTLTVIHPAVTSPAVAPVKSDESAAVTGSVVTIPDSEKRMSHEAEVIPKAVAAGSQVHEHRIDVKDVRFKTLPGNFLDSSDAFPHTSTSE